MRHTIKSLLHIASARQRLRGTCAAALLVTACFGPCHADSANPAADSLLAPGTILELSAVGVSDFQFRVTVDANGEASFPLLEPMRVGGMTLADVRSRLKRDLPHKVFHNRAANGQERFITLSADEIVLTVAEYRPVFVGGDVAKPGAVQFRPGMTAWQAVTLAGGFYVAFTNGDIMLISADVRGQIAAETIEFEKQKAHAAALRGLLDNKPDADIRAELKANLQSAVLDRIAAVERDYVRSSQQDQTKELEHLQEQAAQIQSQIDYLKQEQKTQESGLAQQSQDLDRVRGLYGKGAATISQVNGEERQYGYASERMYQVAAQLMQAVVVAGENKRKIETAVDQRRIRLLTELQDANTRAEVAAAQIVALNDKLAKASRLQGMPDPSDVAEVTLHRTSDPDAPLRAAKLQDVLQPGDDLEVRLPRPVSPIN